jgi:hypothetical protein
MKYHAKPLGFIIIIIFQIFLLLSTMATLVFCAWILQNLPSHQVSIEILSPLDQLNQSQTM